MSGQHSSSACKCIIGTQHNSWQLGKLMNETCSIRAGQIVCAAKILCCRKRDSLHYSMKPDPQRHQSKVSPTQPGIFASFLIVHLDTICTLTTSKLSLFIHAQTGCFEEVTSLHKPKHVSSRTLLYLQKLEDRIDSGTQSNTAV